MSNEQSRRQSVEPPPAPGSEPNAPPPPPPPPPPRPLQRAKDAAFKFIGYPTRPSTPQDGFTGGRFAHGSLGSGRLASLGATQNATASHKTGLEINTIAINESGTHALLGGKEIFKTVKIENGVCAEDLNLRTAIRSTPTSASGRPRQVYSIDIADVAWAKGDCGDYVAAATSSGKIIVYDLGHAGLPAAQLHEHARQVHKVTFNPHRGSLLLSGSQDGTVRLWDVRDARNQASALQSKRKYSGQSDGVRDVKWSPTDGVDFAFGTDSGWIQRWDMRNLRAPKVKVPAHALSCNIIDWHPDGKHIVSGSSDKTVRVWDLSTNKGGKAPWEIKTPYPVMNARWRPSCESSMPQDNGARQCTQLVTGYDREHPIVHIWDLRRPALPFREMAPYASAPTDLLWHSQDLLWTVGREGIFLQSDIQHAPKVMDKRNLQSFAVSPLGDLSLVVQKRSQRRLPKLHHASTNALNASKNLSVSPDHHFISRSWEDDSLDHSFLSFRPTKHHSRTNSGAKMSREYTPGLPVRMPAILVLDEILHNRKSFSPHQHAVTGQMPYFGDDNVFRFLAQKYSNTIRLTATVDDEFLEVAEKALKQNADAAEQAGQYMLAQTWRIIGFTTINHLKERAKYRCEQQGKKETAPSTKRGNKPSLGEIALRFLAEQNSPLTSPASMRPVTSLMERLAIPESTSNVPTPLARPATTADISDSNRIEDLPDVDQSDQLALPPSLATNRHQPSRENRPESRELTSDNLNDFQQQQSSTDRIDMVRRWSVQPRVPLSLDPVDEKGAKVPPKLLKHDSEESFPFLAGTDSREPSLPASLSDINPTQMVAERPSRTAMRGARMLAVGDVAQPDMHSRVREQLPSSATDSPRAPVFATSSITKPDRDGDDAAGPSGRSADEDELYSLPDHDQHDLEEGKPFTLVSMIAELLKYYANGLPNVQVCSQLVTLLVPLLPETHPLSDETTEATACSYAEALTSMGFLPNEVAKIVDQHLGHVLMAGLNPLQMEAILSAYHETLQAHQMFVQAAHLRKLAYPAFPSVYEDAMSGMEVHLKCTGCGKAVEIGSQALKCKGCSVPFVCNYCLEPKSPYGNSLLASCLLCGHSAHDACLREWFGSGGDGCFTEGCLCDCVAGDWRDEKAAEAEKKKGKGKERVKSDDWHAQESKAVKKVPDLLSGQTKGG